MPRRVAVDAQTGFGGGLNLTADISQLGPTELRRADNARLTEYGAVTRRLGTQRIHDVALAAKPVRGGVAWVQAAGTVQELVACNGSVYYGTFATPMTWTDTTGTITETVYPDFCPFRDASADVVYVADGGPLNKWDGANWTGNIASTPNVSILAAYNLRLFGAGDTSNPQRLYYSALSNGDTLGITVSSGGYVDIRIANNTAITGLMALGSSLLIFHKTGVSRFTGWSIDDIEVASGTQGISDDVGTIAPNSLVTVENVGFFMTDRGIYEVNEYGVTPISVPIDSAIRGLDQSKFSRLYAGHNKKFREVWFYLPDIGIYSYNYFLKAWSGPHTGGYVSDVVYSLWPSYDTNGTPMLLAGFGDGFVRRCDAPYVYKDDALSDGTGGDSYNLVAQCHRMFCGDVFNEKAFRFVYVLCDTRGSTNTAASWVTTTESSSATLPADTGATWGIGVWGTFIWGGDGAIAKRVHIGGRGSFADITLTDNGSADSLFSRVELQGFYLGRRF